MPLQKFARRAPDAPYLASRTPIGERARSPTVLKPSLVSSCLNFAPTPGSSETGSWAKNSFASDLPMIENPLGLSRSDASFARNFAYERPIETVMPKSSSILFAILASTAAGGLE